jgi:hypothetical protein
MASRYFNPRLAAGGAAEVDPYFSARGAAAEFERSFEKAEAKRERARLMALKEKAEFNKAMGRNQKIASTLASKMKTADAEKFTPKHYKAILPELQSRRMQAYSVLADPSVDQFNKTILVSDFNQFLSNATALGSKIKEFENEFASIPPEQYSNLNNSQLINLYNDVAEGNYEALPNGMIKLNGLDEPITLEEALEYKPILKNPELKNNILSNLEKIARDTATKGQDRGILDFETEKVVEGMSDGDLAMFGLDYAGLLEGDVGGKILADFNEDGKIDDPDVRKALFDGVKETLQKTVTPLYETYFKEFTPKTTVSERKEIEIKNNIESFTPIIKNIKIPKSTENNLIDLDNTVFTRELAKLNLRVDERGAVGATGGDIIKVTSNITNKSLNLTSDMSDNELRARLLQLVGEDPAKAEEIFPSPITGPTQNRSTIDYNQFLRPGE